MRLPLSNSISFRATEELRAREAALLLVCDARYGDCASLDNLSSSQWSRLLQWLDTSGLALYFLDRVIELQQTAMLPSEVLASLHQRLADNIARTASMIAESAELHREFQLANLCYATLKGFSLFPHSVPKPELRSQMDLDFLVAEESAPRARRILEDRGYYLHATSGRSWEFKTLEKPGISLERVYQSRVCSSAELHIEARGDRHVSPLTRVRKVCFRGIRMPVLSPVDLFLGQGLHLFKHICGEFSRLAHWVEFQRHVVARYSDSAFWCGVSALARSNPSAPAALGMVTLLITRVTGDFAPEALTSWTVDCLPAGARRWADVYGENAAFMSFPGNKLYLLLQKELADSGFRAKRPIWRSVMPMQLPPQVLPAVAGETTAARIRRYRMQAWFVSFRLRFHVVHGFSYLRESVRWRFSTSGSTR
jgi:hypothetical protein